MNAIVILLKETEQKLKSNKNSIKQGIFLKIIQTLLSKDIYLFSRLNTQHLSIIQQVKFTLQQINSRIESISLFASSSNLYILTQEFLQLLTLLYTFFDSKDQQEINAVVQELKSFSVSLLYENDRHLNEVRDLLAKEITTRKHTTRMYNEYFQKAEAQLQESQNLLATKSADTLILNYEQTAKEEQNKANNLFRWGITTIFIGILAVSLLFIDCFEELTHSLSWEHFLFKASIFIMFLIPAIYMLKESAKREEHFFKLKDLSLKIRTIPNYLKDIPNEQATKLSEKDKIRLELAKIIFGQNITTPSSHPNDNTIEELINLLRIALRGK